MEKDGRRLASFQCKIKDIFIKLDVPCIGVFALMDDHHRKPQTGMMDFVRNLLEHHFNMNVDMEESFFVGDAAGRIHGPGGGDKDHSDCDLVFARNTGLKFYTPESFFNITRNNQLELSFTTKSKNKK